VGTVDVTERLDEIERRIRAWDFPGARDDVQALLGESLSDDDRLTARRLLAEVQRELGDLDAAYDLAEAVATQAERRYGPADPRTVHAVAVLAAVRHDYDEWDEAERLYHRVLDSGAEEDGPATVGRAVRLARVNLALLLRDRGETELALSILNAAYVIHRREYGADDLDTIRIAAELAALQFAAGDVLAARRLFTLAHAAARARLGTRHAFTKAVEWELAAVEPPMPSAPVTAPPAPAAPAVVVPEPEPPRRARSVWPLVSVVVALLAASVLAVLLLWPHAGPSASSAAASPSAASPSAARTPVKVSQLRLRDDGTQLTVTWLPLPVTMVVALAKNGAPAVVIARVPPESREYVIRGVDPKTPYCVIVGALDDELTVTPATSVCTLDR
jgi:hypothetical protein